MSDHAVFFDPSRRRWWWIKRIGTLFGLFAVVTVSIWLISLLTLPFLPGVKGVTEPITRSLKKSIRIVRQRPELYLLRKDRASLLRWYARLQKQQRRVTQRPMPAPHIVAAFYAPWQETGLHSLDANADKMTHLLPSWVHLGEGGKSLDFHDWDPVMVPHNNDVLRIAHKHNLNIVPVFSNAELSDFDPARAHALLTTPALQDNIIFQLRQWVLANHFQGINVDFENLEKDDYRLLVPFLRRMKTAFGPNLAVSADLAAPDAVDRPLNWRMASQVCDFIVVMAYDEHGSGSKPGPIASVNWYRSVLAQVTSVVPRDKLVIGLANYGYDWQQDNDWGDPVTYQGALLAAAKYREGEKPEDIIDFDSQALNPTFSYEDFDGKQHEVWFLDAITAANQWRIAQNYAPRGVAVWVLGSTDPTLWNFLSRQRLMQPPDIGALKYIDFPYDVEFVGEGEIAHVASEPTRGRRKLEIDPATGLALDESYEQFPASYVIARSGYKPGLIALTIDDGPAEPYTSQMLDELKKYNVKATFFLIGQNAERHPDLVRRIWAEGHEIGNHSYTHPNLAALPPRAARLELTATQRVIQALIHRSTVLFRPPYNADAEPTSKEEVMPIVIGTEMHYVNVLEFIDPQDWNVDELQPNGHRRTAEEMLASILAQIDTEHGSSILLHDGGGNRSQTVRLIPMVIEALRARGYRFVTVSELMGATRDAVNPPVRPSDMMLIADDRIVFEVIYVTELFLSIAFISAIFLGAARVLFVTVLAIIGKIKAKRATFDPDFKPSVSVVIAAFNEERVIARTIRAVLANRYEPLEIIVVDDGSNDNTSGEVIRAFGDHPQITLLKQENMGKAAALNRGIADAKGDVIIALDADTIFGRGTIARLVRHFCDPTVGAVAGNVKVGNRINPLTYWQSIEYVTSQNVDRRAYALMNAVTVVPGAVGAWRREAVLAAGGYSTDTMAEDMDLTWRIRRCGYRVDNEAEALGYTEVPDSFIALFRQRFRWAFGTLQCLWKHRSAVGRYGWFGTIALPSLWIFAVLFQVLSPLMDLEIAWTLINITGNWLLRGALTHDWYLLPQALNSIYVIGFMYAFFFVVELIGSFVAFKLDGEDSRVLVWLLWQRFLYRQLMYAVLLKSLQTAITGIRAGWGKLDRKGTVVDFEPELLPPIATELQP